MTTLEKLYYGDIAPYEVQVVPGSEYDNAAQLAVQHDKMLTATLTEQQKEQFQKFKDSKIDLMNLGERDAFCRGFSLAVRLMVDAMNREKT